MRAFASVFLSVFLFFAFEAQAQSIRPVRKAQPVSQTNYRFSFYGGAYSPSGSFEPAKYPKFNYETGLGGGFDLTYFFNKNFGLGGFLDFNTFPTEEKTVSGEKFKFTTTSVIFGFSGTGKLNISNKIKLMATARLGGGYNTLEAYAPSNWDRIETSGGAPAASLEGGAVFLFNRWDIGFILKYTIMEQEVKGEAATNIGGLSILLAAGYNF